MHLSLVEGMEGGPRDNSDLYQLPPEIKARVDIQYQRDVARMRPEEAGRMDADYNAFLRELGGAPPPELMGQDGGPGGFGGGMGGPRRQRPGDELPDECKVFVGNLTALVNDQMLSQTFATFGSVVSSVVFGDRGYGFVNFASKEDAKASADAMNGKTLDGKPLVVRLRSERGGGGYGGGGAGGGAPQHQRDDAKLYVAGLPESIDERTLRGMFEHYGQVHDLKLVTDRETGKKKGFAFITMASAGVAQVGAVFVLWLPKSKDRMTILIERSRKRNISLLKCGFRHLEKTVCVCVCVCVLLLFWGLLVLYRWV
jgi:hypothetical protein